MIGIMADSRDNLQSVRQAVRIFKNAGCKLVIHAGDVVAPFAARELENLNCPVKAIFGNCDDEKKELEKTFSSFGEIKEAPLTFFFDDLNFYVTHVPWDLERHANSGKYDIIIYVHSHKAEVRKNEETLLINPGETGGGISGKCTVALLDTKSLSAEILPL